MYCIWSYLVYMCCDMSYVGFLSMYCFVFADLNEHPSVVECVAWGNNGQCLASMSKVSWLW